MCTGYGRDIAEYCSACKMQADHGLSMKKARAIEPHSIASKQTPSWGTEIKSGWEKEKLQNENKNTSDTVPKQRLMLDERVRPPGGLSWGVAELASLSKFKS
jgi:hypothetical protein